MNGKLTELAERRAHLVAKVAAQRVTLAQNVTPWRVPLALADRGVDTVRSIRRHPGWLLGAVLVIVALRPGRAGKFARLAWAGWRVGSRWFRS